MAAATVPRAVDARDAVALALRLALGRATDADGAASWGAAFDAASRELVAPLAWARSRAVIRQFADAHTANAWRRAAMATHLRGQRQLQLLREATGALAHAGVDSVVLKGLPLGEHLYGDAFVRCSADIDLYVPASQRAKASAALANLGWRSTDGGAPWHETWSLWRDETSHHLELHSSLLSDHLAHLAAPPPTAAAVCVAGVMVQAFDGPFVAPYLAAHLATHQMAPLLWLVDFATLWGSLSIAERSDAETAARRARLDRYLDWARRRATVLDRAAAGEYTALGALGVGETRRHDVHSIYRHMALAASAADRARVAIAFLVPRPARRDLGAFIRYTLARLRTRLGSLTGATREYANDSAIGAWRTVSEGTTVGRALRVDRDDMVSLTGDVVRAGGAVWVRAPGGSMLPTIARGALVRIERLPEAGLAKGDIVLALTADGEPVLHRATMIFDHHVVLRGDAALGADPPIPLTRVIGLATHVRDRAGERVLSRHPRYSVAITVLKLRRRVARVVRRAR
jgi:hypothetical protein